MDASLVKLEDAMQKVRLWEVISDSELYEIPGNEINLEERLEGWLASDISALDPNLLVIGRQVRTDFGGMIDLLCLDNVGDTVIVELKKGRTPREVTAQALDYASWVKDLSCGRLTDIADEHFRESDSLDAAFQKQFEKPLPDELNLDSRALIVAESMDASTERIVRYLSSFEVPINVATVQHFKDRDGRSLLAQIYLIELEEAEAKSRSTSRRTSRQTLNGLQEMAKANGIDKLYSRMKDGVRGIFSAQPYTNRVWYRLRRDDGGIRTVLIVKAERESEDGGMGFSVHADRLKGQLGIDFNELRTWLPANSREHDLSGWAGSSGEEKRGARGLVGTFQTTEEVDKFVGALKSATRL